MLSRPFDYLFAAVFGTIQRMIFVELVRVFALCLLALAGVFTLLAVLQQIQFGVSLGQALRMLPLLVPTSIPWITPPACLFASCVVYGRLANDNEAVALKAAGVDLLSVLRPAVGLGLVAAVFTAYLQFGVTPQSWRSSREVLIEDPEEAIGLVLKRKQTLEFVSGKVESDGKDNQRYVKLSVRDVQGDRLMDVVVKQRKGGAGWDDPDVVARTRAAVLRVDPAAREVRLEAEQWEVYTRGASGTGVSRSGEPVRMDLPKEFNLDDLRDENAKNPAMVDWNNLPAAADGGLDLAVWHERLAARLTELHDALAPVEEERNRLAAEVKRPFDGRIAAAGSEEAKRQVEAERDAALGPVVGPYNVRIVAALQAFLEAEGVPASGDPAVRLKQVTDNLNSAKVWRRHDRIMRYEYHLRPAIAVGCLLFAALGCPVGLWANRADYLSIFVICFLPALFVYYPVLFMVGGYARDGRLPMGVGVWAANGVLAAAAAVLSWRLIRR